MVQYTKSPRDISCRYVYEYVYSPRR